MRMLRMTKGTLAGLAALVLASCTEGPDSETAITVSLSAVGQAVRSATAAPAGQRPPLTRAALNTLDGEFLEAEIEKSGAKDFLFVAADRRDDRPGRIVVWRTGNDVTLAVRDGVLIATRGLGNDVLSSDADVMVSALRRRATTTGARRYRFSGLDNKAVALEMACAIENLGRETVIIVERRHVTDHLRETCESGGPRGGRVVNDYWIDSAGSTVWASRQWAGPNIGYVKMHQLTP